MSQRSRTEIMELRLSRIEYWGYEYRRRNPAKFPGIPFITHPTGEILGTGHHVSGALIFANYSDAESLILAILSGDFTYLARGSVRLNLPPVRDVTPRICAGCKSALAEGTDIVLALDSTKSKMELLYYVEEILDHLCMSKDEIKLNANRMNRKICATKFNRIRIIIKMQDKQKLIGEIGLSELKGEPRRRALGLWIWDRVQELGNKHGSVVNAINDLEKTNYMTLLLGEEITDVTVLRRYYDRTNESIRKGKVLPFASK